jgi:hypothetical protein
MDISHALIFTQGSNLTTTGMGRGRVQVVD